MCLEALPHSDAQGPTQPVLTAPRACQAAALRSATRLGSESWTPQCSSRQRRKSAVTPQMSPTLLSAFTAAKTKLRAEVGLVPRPQPVARSLGVAAGCHGTWRSAPAAISGGKRVARPCHESGRSPGPALPRAFCVLLCEHGRHLPTPGAKQASHIVELYHQMAWVVITLKPPSSSGCSAPRRNSPWVPPEMRHPELWAAVPMPQRPLLYEEFPPNTCRLHPAELWVSPSLEASQPLWAASGSLQGKNKLGCFLCAEDKVPDGHFFVIYL